MTTQQQPNKIAFLLGVTFFALVLSCGACGMIGLMIDGGSVESSTDQNAEIRQRWVRLNESMTYFDVVALLGNPSGTVSQGTDDGNLVEIYRWDGEDFAFGICRFENNQLADWNKSAFHR